MFRLGDDDIESPYNKFLLKFFIFFSFKKTPIWRRFQKKRVIMSNYADDIVVFGRHGAERDINLQ